ncbi:hypothetical protein WN55_06108 [Dufourea novaeangliae]|uniref:Meiosis-specific nuclear structural protein 1 n=2 Tax=Dufourea novaeangliae TaxID=178035 RepID=A0A154P270_DUFNO|nr:hypothetical protein WN55_06108 [Dufourea novaeangliae]
MADRRRAMMKRSDIKRGLREMHIEGKKATEMEKLQRAKEVFDLKLRQTERDKKLAEELALRKHFELQEFFQKKKARQAVSILPDSTAQNLEAKLKEKDLENASNSKLPDVWPFIDKMDPRQLQEKKLSYRRELQNQQIGNRRRLREKEEEKHRERKILEEVGEALRKEEVEAERQKKEKVLMLQVERDAFLKARQIWKDKRKNLLKREYEEIVKIVAKKEALQKEESEQKTDTRMWKDAMAENVGKKIQAEAFKKTERERICHELYLAEKENELADEVIRAALRKQRASRELLQDMARHEKAAAERQAKDDAIDAAFIRYLVEQRRKMEEADRKKEQERREKMEQFGNELKETITRNSMQHSEELAHRRFRADDEEVGQNGVPGVEKLSDSKNCAKIKIKCHSESVLDDWKSPQPKKVFT